MPPRAFSSIVLREMIKRMEQIGEGTDPYDDNWATAITKKYCPAIQEQPVVYLTDRENLEARAYLKWFKKEAKVDVAARATQFIRNEHAAEIRGFLRIERDSRPASAEGGSTEEIYDSLPRNDGTPTCFKEWFAVNKVWRLTLAMTDIPLRVAAFGSPKCQPSQLPERWEDELDECMQITDASATLPIPKGFGLQITRNHLNWVLPVSYDATGSSELLNGTILDQWFRILIAHRNKTNLSKAIFISPDSLDLATATPQEVAEKAALTDESIELVFFPTVIKERDHCILLVALPQKHIIGLYDSKGLESTKALQKKRPWINEKQPRRDGEIHWDVIWLNCPEQGEEDASAVFMFTNALFTCFEKDPGNLYSQVDTLFLRRYIAAVICMGEVPENL